MFSGFMGHPRNASRLKPYGNQNRAYFKLYQSKTSNFSFQISNANDARESLKDICAITNANEQQFCHNCSLVIGLIKIFQAMKETFNFAGFPS